MDSSSPLAEPPRNSPTIPDPGLNRANLCFHCNQEGHWFKDCPSRPPRETPEVQCPCGQGACLVLTSRTEKNPDRQFYRCPVLPVANKCKFFKWCDEVFSGQLPGAYSPLTSPKQSCENSPMKANISLKRELRYGVNSPRKPNHGHNAGDSSYPMCSCGAGRCRIWTVEDGEYVGRQYFGCPIKRGQGACNFFRWQNDAAGPSETKNEGLDGFKFPHFSLLLKEANYKMGMDGSKPEGMVPDVPVVPASPLPSSSRERQPHCVGDDFSPIKRLCPDEGDPARVSPRPGKCFKCNKDGHWMSECVELRPCFKCGKPGHWMRDCTE